MGLNWKGTWNPNLVYTVGDVTFYNDSSYVALLGNVDIPPVNPYVGVTWDIVAYQGSQGTTGPTGTQGPPGTPGATGAAGAQGTPGATFTVTGPQGTPGEQGAQGAPGEPGAQGPQGVPGTTLILTGPTGATGAQGLAGPPGAPGNPGSPGAQGLQGIQGVQGAQGVQGVQGPAGTSFVWAGTWTSLHSYVPGQCVGYLNGSYACLNSVTSTSPPNVDSTNWVLMLTGSGGGSQVNSDWTATSGVSQILNKPTLGTAAAQNTSAFDAAGTAVAAVAVETSRAEAAEALLASKIMAVAYAIAFGG